MSATRHPALIVLLLAALLAGCSERTDRPAAPTGAAAASEPADPALAALYNRSCRSCHAIAASGAPLTRDEAAWAARLEKGMDTLLDNTVNGFGGMPPYGMCMDCDLAQFEALIRFMAGETPAR